MYKELIICVIIIILVVFFNTITQNYTKQSVGIMEEELNNIKEHILKKENEDLSNEVESMLGDWKERKDILEYYIEHDELEKVETELTSLKANIQVEKHEEGLKDLEKSIFILKHIKEKYSFKIQNIF